MKKMLAAVPALAAEPDPVQAALGQTLTETLGQMVQWRARAIADEQKIDALQKAADAQKSKPTKTAP